MFTPSMREGDDQTILPFYKQFGSLSFVMSLIAFLPIFLIPFGFVFSVFLWFISFILAFISQVVHPNNCWERALSGGTYYVLMFVMFLVCLLVIYVWWVG